MHSPGRQCSSRWRGGRSVWAAVAAILGVLLVMAPPSRADEKGPAPGRPEGRRFKIAWEKYVDDNWEIFVMNADGTRPVNLTRTPDAHEHYPQVSPDGRSICFTVDSGSGRDAVRTLWVMDIDGRHRRKVAERAREPFWAPDSRTIGYLPQEYPKFSVTDFYTKGMMFYHLDTGSSEPHPNGAKLHHLYNPQFAPNGKWIVATVHAGMGYSHAILLIEARGSRIIDLKIPGCRPALSRDGKFIAWGSEDHELDTAPLDLDADEPKVGPWRLRIKDDKKKIYHIAWSPDGRTVSFSRGPSGRGDPSKPGTFPAACEMVGVHAQGWDLYSVSAERPGTLDLEKAGKGELTRLTTDGQSNKESEWFAPGSPGKE